MSSRHPRVLANALVDWKAGVPISRRTGDVYFSRTDGLHEARMVFLEGNGLPQRFRTATASFCVGETGFGTGLNFLLTRRLFLAEAAPNCSLHFVSVEQSPLATEDRRRFAAMLTARGETQLAQDAFTLDERYPPPISGWHRIVLDEGRVRLSLWLGEATAGFDDWQRPESITVDAWFLDGFAPRVNPELWAPPLMRHLARLSHNATTLATFSVARSVRDALAAAGFLITKAPGPPGKRELLLGRAAPDWPSRRALSNQAVTVAGAGLAGASVARACAERGCRVRVLDPRGPATAASGNRHAVLHPRLSLDDGPRSAFLLAAWAYTRNWLERPEWKPAFHPVCVRQYAARQRSKQFAKLEARFGNLDHTLRWRKVAQELCLDWSAGGHVDLPILVQALLNHPAITLERKLLPPQRLSAAPAFPLILAAGSSSGTLLDPPLPIGRMRGQLTCVRGTPPPGTPILTGRGQAVPHPEGWIVGSSYVRLNADAGSGDERPSAAERAENLMRLRTWTKLLGLPDPAGEVVQDWAGVRATSPDRAPLIGSLTPALWLSTGHASSGLLTCPLAAEAIAAALTGEPPVLDSEITALVAPARLF